MDNGRKEIPVHIFASKMVFIGSVFEHRKTILFYSKQNLTAVNNFKMLLKIIPKFLSRWAWQLKKKS